MTYYFGFLPSSELRQTIDTAYALIAKQSSNHDNVPERYDIYRDKITHLTNKELLDVMLVKLIESLPDDSERKAHLIKVSHTIETTTDKLINTVLSPAKNSQVLPSFEFFDKQVLCTDPTGQRRIGVPLDDKLATELLACMARVQQGLGKAEVNNLTRLFTQLAHASLEHFLVDFTKTLSLNMLKRTAIPVADGVIKKVLEVALHRLIPQMPQESLERFTKYYQPLIFQSQN
ncbi:MULTISPECIES: hypothetical protein [unclassified Moraxella]|uniref:hypothetical protein n=1 Tax=unclassified Moraxella TaxID=2685852 RepID=UPI003AF8A1CA